MVKVPPAFSTFAHYSDQAPPNPPPTPSYYTTSSPAGLAVENEEKRRRGDLEPPFSPLFLLNFSANISGV